MQAREAAVARGPVWAAYLFLLSLLVPIYLKVGSLLLMPHRIVLLAMFIPFFLKLFVFRTAGRVLAADWLMLGGSLWAGAALFANHSFAVAIEPFGIHMVEFFGAYLLARVAIRSSRDFRRVTMLLFLLVCLLLPFAAAESILRRPVLLEMLPGTSVRPINGMGVRFGLRRAQAVFAHPILYGVFVSTGFGMFWYALRPRFLRFPAMPITALATLFSVSTGALISIVLQSIFIGWEMVMQTLRTRWRLFLILFAIFYIALDMASNRSPFHVLVDYASFNSGSAYGRIIIWQFGTDNVWENPIFGLGLNDWVRPSWKSASVDNYWLFTTMQYGLPKIIMVFTALFLMIRQVSRANLTDEGDRLARAGYLVSFGGIAIAAGTVHYWHAMMAFATFIYGSGLWAVTGGAVPADDETVKAEPEAAPRRSRYTRQTAPGVPIGTRPVSAVAAAPPSKPTARRRSLPGRASRAAPLSRSSRRSS